MYVIECPYLSLAKIYAAGQVCRWKKASDSTFVVVDGNDAVKVIQMRDKLLFNCSEQEFYDKWFDYFDMLTDYSELTSHLHACENEYLSTCAVRSKGVRVVKQDLFEVLLSGIFWLKNSPWQAYKRFNEFCRVFGSKRVQSMAECGKVCWYTLPEPEDILDHLDKLRECDAYYLRDLLLEVCSAYVEGLLDVDLLRGMEYDEVCTQFERLIDEKPVALWLARRVCLYCLHTTDRTPDCRDIASLLEKRCGDADLAAVCDWYIPVLLPDQGLVYQQIVYDTLNPPKGVFLL